jgi:hypothetical protein
MFKTIRLFHQLVKFSMLVLGCPISHAVSPVFSAAPLHLPAGCDLILILSVRQEASGGDAALYPGEVDADGAIKADRSIMEDEQEDEMETPPPGYQGQITLKVRISSVPARLCMFKPGVSLDWCIS